MAMSDVWGILTCITYPFTSNYKLTCAKLEIEHINIDVFNDLLKLRVLNLNNTGKPTCDFEIDSFQDDTDRIQYLATSTRSRTRMISQPL